MSQLSLLSRLSWSSQLPWLSQLSRLTAGISGTTGADCKLSWLSLSSLLPWLSRLSRLLLLSQFSRLSWSSQLSRLLWLSWSSQLFQLSWLSWFSLLPQLHRFTNSPSERQISCVVSHDLYDDLCCKQTLKVRTVFSPTYCTCMNYESLFQVRILTYIFSFPFVV